LPGGDSEPPQASAPARPAAARAASEGSIVVTGARLAQQNFSSTTPMVTADEAKLADASIPEGDWNACTVLDPRRDASACRPFADPGARGPEGRAAAQLADGLTLAWQGNLDGAIEAFDRAIGAAPDLSIGYLNRGLAYQAKGDLRRALADLNRAVARDPGSARGYYHRSLLERAKGNPGRADADARRAIKLDPSYQAVLP
jgi:tetratricopeptide (TPR) repeat protein